jgi:plasmid maintenance system antidote protein VapI
MSTSSIIIEEVKAMPMKNPPHPGEIAGDIVEVMGLGVVDAAKGLGVTRQLHNLIAGRSASMRRSCRARSR